MTRCTPRSPHYIELQCTLRFPVAATKHCRPCVVSRRSGYP